MDHFEICLPFVLEQECNVYTGTDADWTNPKNFDDAAHDPGGKTMCGIIQREYDIWRKADLLPCQDVRKITKTEGKCIYLENYWLPHCPVLKPGLDLSFFDESINAGTCEATKVLQAVIGVTIDGLWGPKTQAAVDELGDVRIIVNAFMLRREVVYRQMRGAQWFLTDWLKRSKEIGATSLTMAAGAMA